MSWNKRNNLNNNKKTYFLTSLYGIWSRPFCSGRWVTVRI